MTASSKLVCFVTANAEEWTIGRWRWPQTNFLCSSCLVVLHPFGHWQIRLFSGAHFGPLMDRNFIGGVMYMSGRPEHATTTRFRHSTPISKLTLPKLTRTSEAPRWWFTALEYQIVSRYFRRNIAIWSRALAVLPVHIKSCISHGGHSIAPKTTRANARSASP